LTNELLLRSLIFLCPSLQQELPGWSINQQSMEQLRKIATVSKYEE
jgi:hypothetical protein